MSLPSWPDPLPATFPSGRIDQLEARVAALEARATTRYTYRGGTRPCGDEALERRPTFGGSDLIPDVVTFPE